MYHSYLGKYFKLLLLVYGYHVFQEKHGAFQHLPGRLPASSTDKQGKREQSQNRAKRLAQPGRHWKTFQ